MLKSTVTATVDIETSVRLDLDSNGMLMTPEESDAVEVYNDEWCYELINGVVIVNAIPLESEGDPNEELGYLLRRYQEGNPASMLNATLPERFIHLPNSRRRADRVIWAGLGRMPNSKFDVPTVAVESVSRTKPDRERDYEEKRKEYIEAGIQEYWIFDRFKPCLTVIRPKKPDQVVPEAEHYQSPPLPGFDLPLARLLQQADAWAE